MTILQTKAVKVRKNRQCFSCLRVFPIGTQMTYQANIYEGDFCQVYWCETCGSIMNKFNGTDTASEGFPEGFVFEGLNKGQTPEDYLKAMI